MNAPKQPPGWRPRASSALALAAALAFAFQPPLTMAQQNSLPAFDIPALPAADSLPAPDKEQSPPPVKPKKKAAHRHTATDFVSDDLNRRESERAAQVAEQLKAQANGSATATPVMTSTPVPGPLTAAPTLPTSTSAIDQKTTAQPPPIAQQSPTPLSEQKPTAVEPSSPTAPAIPPRPPIVTASLTPTTGAPAAPPASPQNQAQAPSPPPVPILPPNQPSGGAPSDGGAPSRPFAQSQLVPTQQPTLSLEVNKGTALRLPGPAATVFVAAPDIADVQVKSPSMIYVFAKKGGDTVLYAVDDHDRVLLNTIVHVTSPISRMKSGLDALHPGNGVNFDNQGETIVLTGTVRSALVAEDARRLALQQVNQDVRKVINNIRVDAPNQVQLRVKIAEVDKNSLKRYGINWMNISNIALWGIVPTVSAGFGVSTIQSTGGAGSGAIALQTTGGLNGLIDLLATQNKATVLAEPNLIAMSGETASFLAGGEIPIVAPQAGLTGSTISVTYKDIGVMLAFTPTIVGDRINLKVAPEVSQISSNGSISVPLTATSVVTIPALTTRRASTTVELASGQSFAIAGLMQQTSEQDINKIPWLGDVPIIGTLFKSDAYQRAETELVIVVTPYLVEPSSEPLRTPLTSMVPPTDVDRLLMQRLNHPTAPTTVPVAGGAAPGSQATAGFKLD